MRSLRCRSRISRVCCRSLSGARDVGADLIVAPLYRRHLLGMFGVDRTLLLKGRLGAALVSKRRLHRHVTLAYGAVVHQYVAVEIAHLERQQLRQCPAFLILERLIAPRRCGLPLQMSDLTVDLIANVLQTFQIPHAYRPREPRSPGGAPCTWRYRPPPRQRRACLRAWPR